MRRSRYLQAIAAAFFAARTGLTEASAAHTVALPRANVELLAIEKNQAAALQAVELCGKYVDSCAKIVDAIGGHVAYLEEHNLDFAIVNLTIPTPDANVVALSILVDGHVHSIPLQMHQDPSLAIAMFCRAHPSLSMNDCDSLHGHAIAKSQFEFPKDVPSSHYFRTLRPRQLCPLNQRLYLEIDRLLEHACYFMDTQPEPAYCGRLDRDEPMFVKANVIGQPGPHFVLLTNGTHSLHAVFFAMVEPSVQLKASYGKNPDDDIGHVVMHLEGVDVGDERTRVCLVSTATAPSPPSFDCFKSSALSNDMLVPRLSHTTTSVMALVLNEYNKCTCMSNVIQWPSPRGGFSKQTILAPDRSAFAPPRRHPNKGLLSSSSSLLHSLYDQEWGVYSQNGEDGVLQLLFQVVPATTKVFVEFGVEDGLECNTRYLREVHDWTGLLLDGSHANDTINLHQAWITLDNVVDLFQAHAIPQRFDLLSVDIDFNDYYILDAILHQYTPTVVVVETNSHFRYPDDRVVTYDPHGWDGETNYFGASVAAFVRLLTPRGYTLVYCESHGVNCFFVMSELWPATWTEEPATIDRPPNFFGKGWSYPPSPHATWVFHD
ncbi:hypothetical protein DYB25_012559 [Aphanomyces astaci]|uniref:Methyltransferase FkbM domain-containing protein n=1 Tax=Aphanomyces astaci TaxID=112090 RepID=A0A397BK83_APHAT|nr:hypothetical protein DYB25_012559 [Aphanomyces astaci]